jgi:hypothetical protein
MRSWQVWRGFMAVTGDILKHHGNGWHSGVIDLW